MSAPRRSVLVGFADALAAPEVAASLLQAGHRVSAFKRRGETVALRKLREIELVEVTAPEDDLPACAEEVATLATNHDLTMPLDDLALLVCDRGLPAEAPISGPRGAQARLALDKRLQLRAAEVAGLEVPPWVEVAAEDTGQQNAHNTWTPPPGWTLPAVLKPALAAEEHEGRLRRLAPRLLSSEEQAGELLHTWGAETPALLQRWVSGTGAGVFGIADAEGVHLLSAHRRVRMMNPAGSGSSA